MSWSCKHLSPSEIEDLVADGSLRRLYDDSKDKIENKNYDLYDSESDISDDEKFNHWFSVMSSHASQSVLSDPNKDFYTIGAFFNDEIYMMSANYYDSSDKSYNYCHALVGKKDGSKGYAFGQDFWDPQSTLMKSLGATQMIFWSTPGGSLSFRSATAKGNPSIFDYSNMAQTEEVDDLDIDSVNENIIPTEDGSTKENTTMKLLEKQAKVIKTVRPLV